MPHDGVAKQREAACERQPQMVVGHCAQPRKVGGWGRGLVGVSQVANGEGEPGARRSYRVASCDRRGGFSGIGVWVSQAQSHSLAECCVGTRTPQHMLKAR